MQSVLYEIVTGVGIGIIMALPTGPIGFLVIRRMIVYGWGAGMWSAVGSISGDAFYAAVALLGITQVHEFVTSIQTPVRLLVGIYLLYLGIVALRKAKKEVSVQDTEFSRTNDFLSTFLLAFGSPHNLAPFVVAFSIVGVGSRIVPGQLWIFAIALLAGSLLWWIGCGLGIEKMRSKGHTGSSMRVRMFTAWIIIVSGVGFMGIAIYQLFF